jgi:PAS domain S-box-containing protein
MAAFTWGVFSATVLFLQGNGAAALSVAAMSFFLASGGLSMVLPLCNPVRLYVFFIMAPVAAWGIASRSLEGFALAFLSLVLTVFQMKWGKKADNRSHNGLCSAVSTSELVRANRELENEILYRINVEKALRASEERYRTLFQNNPIETIIVDHNARITGYNKAKARSLGRIPEIGDIMYKDYGSRHSNNMFEELMDCIRTGRQKEFPEQKYNERYLLIRISPYSGGAIITSLDITKTKKAEEQIQTLTREILMIQEKERKRIARDLHDSVAQDLSSLRITCETFFDDIPENSFKIRHKVKEISKILQGSIHAIRDIAYELRPPSLDELGLPITLFRYCEDFKQKWGINVDFFSAGLEQTRIDADTEINLYRLVQESLNNIRKHSHATKAVIRLVASYPHVILRVEDNGVGFDPGLEESIGTNNKRMGLRSMEERVSLLGGKMAMKSRPGEGTRLFVEVPALKIEEKSHGSLSAMAANE